MAEPIYEQLVGERLFRPTDDTIPLGIEAQRPAEGVLQRGENDDLIEHTDNGLHADDRALRQPEQPAGWFES